MTQIYDFLEFCAILRQTYFSSNQQIKVEFDAKWRKMTQIISLFFYESRKVVNKTARLPQLIFSKLVGSFSVFYIG